MEGYERIRVWQDPCESTCFAVSPPRDLAQVRFFWRASPIIDEASLQGKLREPLLAKRDWDEKYAGHGLKGYDPYGRFLSVTSTIAGTERAFTYDWDEASGLLEGWSSGNFGVVRGYEAQRPVLAYIENKYTNGVVSRYDYTVDAVGRRSAAVHRGSAFDIGTTRFDYTCARGRS